MPTLPKIFRAVARNTLVFYLALGPDKQTFRVSCEKLRLLSDFMDQRLCYSLIGKDHIKTCQKQNFTILARFFKSIPTCIIFETVHCEPDLC